MLKYLQRKSIIPILDALCEWGEEQLQQISQGTMT